MTRTPQHELVQTAAARPTETDSRDVLLAALQEEVDPWLH